MAETAADAAQELDPAHTMALPQKKERKRKEKPYAGPLP
jgi:hypothetical protein